MAKDNHGLITGSQSMASQKLQWEHEEKTVWQEKFIIAKGKVFALIIVAIGCMIALCIASVHPGSAEKLIEVAGHLIIGVVSFFAGGASSFFNKTVQHPHQETHD